MQLATLIVLGAVGACLWLDRLIGRLSSAVCSRLDYLINHLQRRGEA
jgi:hypothetical protein